MTLMSIRNTVLVAMTLVLMGALPASAVEISFNELVSVGGLTGDLIFADLSDDGTLVNAGTGDSTGINQGGNSSGNTWGRKDASDGANNTTLLGANEALRPNSPGGIVEGFGTSPDLQWTVNAGSGDSGGFGSGSLMANSEYNVHVHYLTHTAASQNWGGEVADNAAFVGEEDFNRLTGTLITTVGGSNVDYRLLTTTFSVMTDAGGNADLFFRRPGNDFNSVRTNIDGVVFELVPAAIPEPATATLALLGVAGLAARRRRNA